MCTKPLWLLSNFLLARPLQAAIRKELNDFKSNEMEVHESSRHLTRYCDDEDDGRVRLRMPLVSVHAQLALLTC